MASVGNTNTRKKFLDQLGVSQGSSSSKLRKIIIWEYAAKHRNCFRCGTPMTLETFSIDHKVAWLDVNPDLFWDIENIDFSHFICNVSSGRRNKRATNSTV